MESAAPRTGVNEPAPVLHHRGTNQSGMRDTNERVVLTLVRQHGSLAKSDIARITGLSAQTVSVIMRELESEGLLLKGEPQRGRVGQPSVPMSLSPEGAFFLGLKIGRRSAELVLIDFLGKVRETRQHSYPYPTPGGTIEFLLAAMKAIRGGLSPERDRRIAGLGIAMPFELWNWAEAAGAPQAVMDQWRDRDIRAEVQQTVPFPVYLQNDASSACGAELVLGQIGALRDFVYFYIGAFAGGGVVLNARLYSGQSGNAGALGSMPVPGADGRPVQLIDVASLATLERDLRPLGIDATYLWTSPERWPEIPDAATVLDRWLEAAGRALAYAIVGASAVIDFEAAIIDGWMPVEIRQRLTDSVRGAMTGIDVEGLRVPTIREGTVGIHARALGGASLPLFERFMVGASFATVAV